MFLVSRIEDNIQELPVPVYAFFSWLLAGGCRRARGGATGATMPLMRILGFELAGFTLLNLLRGVGLIAI